MVSKHTISYNWYCGLWTYLITHLGDRHDGRLVIISTILVKSYNMDHVHYIMLYLTCLNQFFYHILDNQIRVPNTKLNRDFAYIDSHGHF